MGRQRVFFAFQQSMSQPKQKREQILVQILHKYIIQEHVFNYAFNSLDIGNYCLPNLKDLGVPEAKEEAIRSSYNKLLDAIGADAIG